VARRCKRKSPFGITVRVTVARDGRVGMIDVDGAEDASCVHARVERVTFRAGTRRVLTFSAENKTSPDLRSPFRPR
jgi:hypothetical protein